MFECEAYKPKDLPHVSDLIWRQKCFLFLNGIPCSYKDDLKESLFVHLVFVHLVISGCFLGVMLHRLDLHLLGGNVHKLPQLISLPLLKK